jgi:hypothetical protein
MEVAVCEGAMGFWRCSRRVPREPGGAVDVPPPGFSFTWCLPPAPGRVVRAL